MLRANVFMSPILTDKKDEMVSECVLLRSNDFEFYTVKFMISFHS